jgi:hypothetical protein
MHPRDDHELLPLDHRLGAVVEDGGKQHRFARLGRGRIVKRWEPSVSAFKIVIQVADNGEIAIPHVRTCILVWNVMPAWGVAKDLSSRMFVETDPKNSLDQRLDDLVHLSIKPGIEFTGVNGV